MTSTSKLSNTIQLLEETPTSKEGEVDAIAKFFGIENYCRLVRSENRKLTNEKEKLEEIEVRKGNKRLSRRERRRLREKDRRKYRKNTPPLYPFNYNSQENEIQPYDNMKTDDSSSHSSDEESEEGEDKTEFITEINVNNDTEEINFFDEDIFDEYKEELKDEEGIFEANDNTDIGTAILRKPGDRWNFAKAIDEKFNHPRYRVKKKCW